MKTRRDLRIRRKKHVRKYMYGTEQKPRVFVFKSNRYIYAGIANDDEGVVISTCSQPKKKASTKELAKCILKTLKDIKVDTVVFDRSGYKYHGIIKEFVEALRENKINV